MTWGAVAGAAVGVVGGMMSSDAAGDAADAQSQAAQAASMQQMMAQQQMREDLAPWVETGRGANSLLSRYLGVGGVGSGGRTSLGLSTGLSPTDLRNQLMGRFTRSVPGGSAPLDPSRLDQRGRSIYEQAQTRGATPDVLQGIIQQFAPDMSGGQWQTIYSGGAGENSQQWVPGPAGPSGPTSEIDEAGLQSAMDQYYREQDEQNRAAESDPTYGSLLRAYRGGAEFDSGPAFSFTGKDVATDPGYQFGMQQGQQGIDRAQAARGNFLSGAAIKEASRFNSDYAGTKFNEAFNRASSTYGTNLSRRQNEWNTNLGAYNQNRNSIYNYLTGASNTGQASAAQVGSNNQQVANSVGNNLMAAGNAQAAGIVGGSNALVSGMNQGMNALQSTNNVNSASGWNNLLAAGNIGRSGNNYNGSSSDPYAANYTNSFDRM